MTKYVWIKRDLFECPKHQGYTGIRDSAGTWPLEDAQRFGLPIKEAYDRSHEHYALPIEAAPEFTNACFDDLARDHLQAKCAAKDAEIEVLRKALTGLRSYFLTHGWDEKSMMVENIDQALNGGGNGRS